MPERKLIKTEALIVGYAMARLGPRLLGAMGWHTQTEGFEAASVVLGEKFKSIKNLRDEFDVFFPNARKGWRFREPYPTRVNIVHEFSGVSDNALIELVKSYFHGDTAAFEEAAQLVAEPPKRVANVAERLLTGRLAEEYFWLNSQDIIDIPPTKLLDMRQRACGYDFGAIPHPKLAIEVKGIKSSSGGILFTDHEWSEAKIRGSDYWLVLVGNLDQDKPEPPKARVFPDPAAVFADQARCNIVQSTAAEWRVTASL